MRAPPPPALCGAAMESAQALAGFHPPCHRPQMVKKLAYTGSPLDRMAARRADPAWMAEILAHKALRVVPVWRDRNLLTRTERPEALHLTGAGTRALLGLGATPVVLGVRDGTPHIAVDLSHHEPDVFQHHLPDEADFADLRAAGGLLDPAEASVLAAARGMQHWHKSHKFCAWCGSATEPASAGHVRKCANGTCGRSHFPRTDAAVIMLVTHTFPDGVERCLLGWSKRWDIRMYSTLAGFVEPGESLEEAVARETREEAGVIVPVEDVIYKGSQPWPFPASLMLGFQAVASNPALDVEEEEMRECRWFARQELAAFGEYHDTGDTSAPRLPRPDSIARELIEDWRGG